MIDFHKSVLEGKGTEYLYTRSMSNNVLSDLAARPARPCAGWAGRGWPGAAPAGTPRRRRAPPPRARRWRAADCGAPRSCRPPPGPAPPGASPGTGAGQGAARSRGGTPGIRVRIKQHSDLILRYAVFRSEWISSFYIVPISIITANTFNTANRANILNFYVGSSILLDSFVFRVRKALSITLN